MTQQMVVPRQDVGGAHGENAGTDERRADAEGEEGNCLEFPSGTVKMQRK